MVDHVILKQAHHELLSKRRTAVETKFNVKILPFFSYSAKQKDTKISEYDCSRKEMVVETLVGKAPDVEALKKYVDETFVNPEIIDIFTYHPDLETIFGNAVWIEIFEEFYNVCITVALDCELNISGTEPCVASTVAAMEELIMKYHDCKDQLLVSSEKSIAGKLVTALTACKNIHVPSSAFDGIPNEVIKLLLSLLEKTYRDSFPVFDDSESLEDSVMIIDAPKEEVNVPVIVLDSDSDSDDNSKRPHNSCSTDNGSEKKQKLQVNKSRKMRRQKLQVNKSRKMRKKSRAVQNTNGLQGGSDILNHSGSQNDKLQCPKVEDSIDESMLPKVENPNFIPLSLESKGNNGSSSKIPPPQQAGQSPSEVQVKNEGIEITEETSPKPQRKLRPIVIDGCNVAFYATHGRHQDFSWKRIEISLKYFLDRGHDVKVFLPQYRRPICYAKSGNQQYIEELETKQMIVFTPSRRVDGRTISCYDDRFIVDLASRNGGIIFSNDNYRDLINENPNFAKTIKERLLMYVFAGDELMIPEDPLGKTGPPLNEFISFPPDK